MPKLTEYNKKRNFEKTPEPSEISNSQKTSKSNKKRSKLLYVIQHHIARRDHYDLRLEWEGTLLSWAVPKGPSFNPDDKRLAIHVEDHPISYKDFEGTIPKGEYGGGTVMLFDEGFYEPLNDFSEGLKQGSLKFTLYGKRIKGNFALIKIKSEKEKEEDDNWLLIKENDAYQMDSDGISGFTTSIRTGRTMEQIANNEESQKLKNPFSFTNAQLAKLVAKPPIGEDWLFEVKYDGYRILAYVEENSTVLFTRNGNDFTQRFSVVADTLSNWSRGRAFVLDGEMIITDEDGKSDFQALQSFLRQKNDKNLSFVVFDILALDGDDLRNNPLIKRKQILNQLLIDAPKNIIYSKHIEGNGQQCFEAACKLKLEGIIGKKADSMYSGARNSDWVKIKCDNRQEFVIGGYTKTDKKESGLSALLLGVFKDKDLIYVGRTGTGFNQRNTKELMDKLSLIKADKPFFVKPPKPSKNEIFTWVKPQLVAEVKFSEWTKDNLIRQGSYKGLRIDKSAKEVVLEQPQEITKCDNETIKEEEQKADKNINDTFKNIKITNPDKVIFTSPIVKKIDVIDYYKAVSKRMMPFVSNRILSVVRCPKGVESACFFKKHPAETPSDGIGTINITSSGGKNEEYFYIKNTEGLIWETQMGTLEFHIWGSKITDKDTPDMMVFDLDPDAEMSIKQIRQGVRDLKSILDQLNLVSYLKTSGGKGYHVVVPFKPSVKWDAFYDFSKRIVVVMENKWQDLYTSNIRKDKRKGKIFIDWVRNGRGATSIAPYSLRARQGATVSMPIFWSELDKIAPNDIKMQDALKRIKEKDPWEDFYLNRQELTMGTEK